MLMGSRSETYEYSARVVPNDETEYPLTVHYCGECTMPIEYCEFSHAPDACKLWLEKNLPEIFEQLDTETAEDGETKKKSRQVRGGKGTGGRKHVEQKISLFRTSRGKNKYTTSVIGLNTFGIDLRVASKFFGQKFATGSSATSNGEIVIQGDVKDDLFEIIPEKWPQVEDSAIEDLGDMKR